jgi:hypothetical protein
MLQDERATSDSLIESLKRKLEAVAGAGWSALQ